MYFVLYYDYGIKNSKKNFKEGAFEEFNKKALEEF